MFRADDKGIQNIINSCYAVKMELPECITDQDRYFEDLGCSKEVVRNGDVRIIKSNSRHITIFYVDKLKEIEKNRLEKYKVIVQTKCVVLKIKALWNSSENNLLMSKLIYFQTTRYILYLFNNIIFAKKKEMDFMQFLLILAPA